MARHLPLEHFCPWREEAEELRERLTTLEVQMKALQKQVFGRKSERLPQANRKDGSQFAESGSVPSGVGGLLPGATRAERRASVAAMQSV